MTAKLLEDLAAKRILVSEANLRLVNEKSEAFAELFGPALGIDVQALYEQVVAEEETAAASDTKSGRRGKDASITNRAA
jgi:hypothetical protein